MDQIVRIERFTNVALSANQNRFALIGLSYRAGANSMGCFDRRYGSGGRVRRLLVPASSCPVTTRQTVLLLRALTPQPDCLLPTHESLCGSVRDGSVRGCRGRPQQK